MAINGGDITITIDLDSDKFDKRLQSTQKTVNGNMPNTFKRLGSVIAACFSVKVVTDFAKASVSAASELNNAMQGLQSIVEGQGRSFAQANDFIQDYISDGLVPMTNAVAAYKNLAARGYSDEQIKSVMVALKDSAAYGRQASYSLGEAVAGATEGLKNENSILVDNAGVTKNVAKMWDDYAAQIGTTSNNLTQQQKIQAEVNGILEETRFQTGDAAKVANSFSGQLSQISFRFNEMKVALGNALIPAIQAVLPYLNTFLDYLTRIFNVFGQFTAAVFGIESQTSAMESNAEATQKAASAQQDLADETKKSAKAADKATASFDTLNVLQSGNDSTTSDSSVSTPTVTTTPSATVDSIEADTSKISYKVQKLANNFKKALQTIYNLYKKFSPLIKGVAGFAGVLFGAAALKKIYNYAKGLTAVKVAAGLFKSVFGGIVTAFKASKNPLKILQGGFKGLQSYMQNLSPITKFALSVAGMTATFVTVKNAVYDYMTGQKTLGEVLLNVIPVCTAVGVAMYAMLGPLGLVLGAVAAVSGAIYGYIKAEEEMQQKQIEETFFDGVGIGLEKYTEKLKQTYGDIETYSDKISELTDEYSQNKEEMLLVEQEVSVYEGILINSGKLTEEQTQKMKECYSKLYEGAQTNIDLLTQTVLTSYTDSLKTTAEKSGVEIDNLIAQISKLSGDASDDLATLKEEQQKLFEKIVNGTATDADKKRWQELNTTINNIATGADKAQIHFDNLKEEIQKIDFKNTEEAQKKIEELQQAAQDLLQKNKDSQESSQVALQNLKNSIEEVAKASGKSVDVTIFDQYESAIKANYQDNEKAIKSSISSSINEIKTVLEGQLVDTAEKTKPTFWQRFLIGNDTLIKQDIAKSVYNTVGKPIEDKLTEMENTLGLDASRNIGENIAESIITGASTAIEGKGAQGLVDAGASIPLGVNKGVESELDTTNSLIYNFGVGTGEQFAKGTDSHSPSKVFEKQGKNIVDGLNKGITDNTPTALRAIDVLCNAMIKRAELACNNIRSAMNNLFKGMQNSLNGITIDATGKIKYTEVPKIKIPRLAQGAVLPPNREFLAVLGDQKHGRNLEAPEDLIRQIVREETAEQAISVTFKGSLAELARVLAPEIKKENKRASAWS